MGIWVQISEHIDVALVNNLVNPGTFDREEAGVLFILFWSCQIDRSMGSIYIATEDDFVTTLFGLVDIFEESIIKAQFEIEALGTTAAVREVCIYEDEFVWNTLERVGREVKGDETTFLIEFRSPDT